MAKQADRLGAALVAIRANKLADALPLLLGAWRDQPSEKLAEVIAMVSVRTRVEAPRLRGKTAAALAAWMALAKKPGPANLPALLDSIADAASGEGIKRLAAIAKAMPDPRIDDALVTLMETVPYRATSTRPFWNTLFPLAERITDPRQLSRIERAEAAGVAQTMGDWLRVRYAKLVAELAPRLGVPHAESPILDELAGLLGPRKLSVGTQNVTALLQAVYDAPDDDAPRLVYADALQERDDPRGELVAIQLGIMDKSAEGRARSSAEGDAKSIDSQTIRRREKELLDTHGKQWLGALAPIVMAGYRFERGFLAACRIDNRHVDRVRKLVGNPAWATVRELAGSAAIALDPVMRSLRRLEFVSYEARNHEGLPGSWADLLLGSERPLEALRYTGLQSDRHFEDALENNRSIRPGVQGRWIDVPEASELEALCMCRALPALRELVVVEDPDLVAEPLLGSAIVKRLEYLGFVFDARSERRPPLEWFAAALRDAPVATFALDLGSFHTTTVRFERGATGYERLAMTVGPATTRSNWSEQLVNEAIAILDAAPRTLREIRITMRRQTEATQIARLRAAASQMKLDLCEVA
ncbi:MAG: TIGR02996 domain-containing protein [Kofleriaceae bacterium]